ncbi:MAG: rubrerythrin family protein [Bacillota bacterium]
MIKNEKTAENLRSAFGGESQAYQRYTVWGRKAKENDFPGVALLFEAISFAETVHAGNHFNALNNIGGDFLVASKAGFGIGSTAENLAGAINGEEYEIEQMYPSYYLVAKDQEENDAILSFHYALEAEKIHAKLYKEAKQAVEDCCDYELDFVSICEVCGYTVKDDTPEKCPICGASKEEFKIFEK